MLQKSRRLNKEEFKLLFDIFITLQLPNRKRASTESDKNLPMLVRQEAEDVFLPFFGNAADKKVKREIFREHFNLSKDAYARSDDCEGWNEACLAITNGYTFFYGEEWVELLKEHAKPISDLIKDNRYRSLSVMLDNFYDEVPNNEGADCEILHELHLDDAYQDFLKKG